MGKNEDLLTQINMLKKRQRTINAGMLIMSVSAFTLAFILSICLVAGF